MLTKINQKKLVLVLHGFPGLTSDDPIRKYLKSNKYQVVIPDLFNENIKFNKKDLLGLITNNLKGKKPDVIIAASLGGFIAPYVAKIFPKAKLVMLATGSRLNTKIPIYNLLVNKSNKMLIKLIVFLFNRIPVTVCIFVYKFFNPLLGDKNEELNFKQHVIEVIQLTRKILPEKIYEIAQFVRQLDNIKILKSLDNRTLIFTGDGDVMMPASLSYELERLIPKNKLLFNKNRMHHNIFDERDFSNLDKFLESKR
jgi:esterase/lipase